MKVLLVTGLSGAGRSSALRALEDLGLRCVDNLPPGLLAALVDLVARDQGARRIAVGVDSRGIGRASDLLDELLRLEEAGHEVELIYLEAPDATLLRRFSETRRRHPLGTLPDAITRERELLAPVRERASLSVDTENLRARELRRLISDRFGGGGQLRLVLTSFGFKKGLPPEADLVFDVRGLDNPHWEAQLRPRSGFHPAVEAFVLGQAPAEAHLELMEAHVRLQVPGSAKEGRMHLTVAIGCTGGQHRSVVLTRELARRLRHGVALLPDAAVGADARAEDAPSEARVELEVRHRDVDRSGDDD